MIGALAEALLGPLMWLMGGIVTAIGVWWAATSRANAKADTDRAEEALRRAEHENAIRKDIQDAIHNSKRDRADWHKRLHEAVDGKRGRL
jgi:hypothetical protein